MCTHHLRWSGKVWYYNSWWTRLWLSHTHAEENFRRLIPLAHAFNQLAISIFRCSMRTHHLWWSGKVSHYNPWWTRLWLRVAHTWKENFVAWFLPPPLWIDVMINFLLSIISNAAVHWSLLGPFTIFSSVHSRLVHSAFTWNIHIFDGYISSY